MFIRSNAGEDRSLPEGHQNKLEGSLNGNQMVGC